MINKNDFIDFFGSKELLDNVNYYTRTLRYSDRERILEHLINNIDDDNYSITLISRENGINFRPKLIYSSQSLINEERDKALENISLGARIDLNKIDAYLNTYKNDYKKNKDRIENEVKLFRDFLKNIILEKETYGISELIEEQTADLPFYNLQNDKLGNKYTYEKIEEMWLKDFDKNDELFNLSKSEDDFYKNNPNKLAEDFRTNYDDLKEEVKQKEQRETKKKDKDQEMSL